MAEHAHQSLTNFIADHLDSTIHPDDLVELNLPLEILADMLEDAGRDQEAAACRMCGDDWEPIRITVEGRVESFAAADLPREDQLELLRLSTLEGRHFTEVFDVRWLRIMEGARFIKVDYPVHPVTGLMYGQLDWRVRVLLDLEQFELEIYLAEQGQQQAEDDLPE